MPNIVKFSIFWILLCASAQADECEQNFASTHSDQLLAQLPPDYVGPSQRFQSLPVLGWMFDRHQKKEDAPANEVFARVVEAENAESCNCRPNIFQKVFIKVVDGMNFVFRAAFFRSISSDSLYQDIYGVRLNKSSNDEAAVDSVSSRQRRNFVRSLTNSIRADLQLTELYLEMYQLAADVKALGKEGLEAFRLIKKYGYLSARLVNLQIAKARREVEGRPIHKGDPDVGKYSKQSVELRSIAHELDNMKTEIHQLLKDGIRTAKKDKKGDDVELIRGLLSKWRALHKKRIESQIALVKFYVRLGNIRIFDGLLEGDLQGMNGAIDEAAIDELHELLVEHKIYLANKETLGPRYVDSTINYLNPEMDLVDRYNAVRELARSWERIWEPKIREIEPRKELVAALTRIGMEWMRFWANNSPRAQVDNIGGAIKWAAAKFRLGGVRKVAKEDLTEEQGERLDKAIAAFDLYAKFVRKEDGTSLNKQQQRDALSDMAFYFDMLKNDKIDFDDEIIERLASARGVQVLNYLNAVRARGEIGGDPYSNAVISAIIKIQARVHLSKYVNAGQDIVENMIYWGAAASGLYYQFFSGL